MVTGPAQVSRTEDAGNAPAGAGTDHQATKPNGLPPRHQERLGSRSSNNNSINVVFLGVFVLLGDLVVKKPAGQGSSAWASPAQSRMGLPAPGMSRILWTVPAAPKARSSRPRSRSAAASSTSTASP